MNHKVNIIHLIFWCFLSGNLEAKIDSNFNVLKSTIDSAINNDDLTKASEILKSINLDNFKDINQQFYFKSMQMDLNYYHDLRQLGLVDAKKYLEWALEFGTPEMIMDAYNFNGLFLIQSKKTDDAIEHFKLGMNLKPNTSKNFELNSTRPYHILNNLAEAYHKKHSYDSSLYFSEKALQGAIEGNDKRMQALSLYQKSVTLQKVKDLDEALKALKDALAIAINAKQYDVTLLCLGALSGLENIDKITQLNYLKQAYVIIDKHKNVNDYYKKDFYYHALDFYKKEKNFEQENEIRKKLASIEENKKVKELDYLIKQYDEVIQKTEDNLVLEKANSEKSRQLQYLSIIIAIISCITLFATIIIFRLRIKRKEALMSVRSTIARDLHDEIGSSISSLNIYSNILTNKFDLPPQKQNEIFKKIEQITQHISSNLHDIIWSLDTQHQQTSLEDMVKSYAMNMLTNKSIDVHIHIDPQTTHYLQSPKAKRNILLIIKELINNCSKHSQASLFNLSIETNAELMSIKVSDNGIGIDLNAITYGNGIRNIETRVMDLDGKLKISRNEDGHQCFLINIPTQSILIQAYTFTKKRNKS